MTFSLLVHDHETGTYGGAAATGSLCVGGWVLRGGLDSGLSASQGTAPSTFWGEDVLRAMRDGSSAPEAVASITNADPGRGHRQLSALDLAGRTAGFTGAASVPHASHISEPGLVVAGNMLGGEGVLPALRRGYLEAVGSMAERLVAALRAADADASDKRGLSSAGAAGAASRGAAAEPAHRLCRGTARCARGAARAGHQRALCRLARRGAGGGRPQPRAEGGAGGLRAGAHSAMKRRSTSASCSCICASAPSM